MCPNCNHVVSDAAFLGACSRQCEAALLAAPWKANAQGEVLDAKGHVIAAFGEPWCIAVGVDVVRAQVASTAPDMRSMLREAAGLLSTAIEGGTPWDRAAAGLVERIGRTIGGGK